MLGRTRLVDPKKRPSLESIFEDAVKRLKTFPIDENTTALSDLSKSLIRLLREYGETHPGIDQTPPTTNSDLEEIVSQFYRISRIPNFETIFDRSLGSLQNRDPSIPPALLHKIRKIGSYRTLVATLINISRHYPNVRQASTLTVPLNASSFFYTKRRREDFIGVENVPQRIAKTHETTWDTNRVQSLKQKLNKRLDEFLDMLESLESHSKVHAEIQLVWHLRQHRSSTPPG
ncbi:hypothetical protein B0J13DRAFT_20404 [Dactylonectria estremocensis]|uniref:Uncharacterized protein n=1 Tax=Dactylonectria estremocensis TaxID=1079267 RepID=A0A9P9FIC6_9HYPO|nr:hypothetical protein B0J13DRAFT_20404 [Dactylonectria estremocensis]